jgi:hypothetical protein
MVAGRRYELYAWFSASAGRGKEPGAEKTPTRLADCRKSIVDCSLLRRGWRRDPKAGVAARLLRHILLTGDAIHYGVS